MIPLLCRGDSLPNIEKTIMTKSFDAKFPLNSSLDLDHWAKRLKGN